MYIHPVAQSIGKEGWIFSQQIQECSDSNHCACRAVGSFTELPKGCWIMDVNGDYWLMHDDVDWITSPFLNERNQGIEWFANDGTLIKQEFADLSSDDQPATPSSDHNTERQRTPAYLCQEHPSTLFLPTFQTVFAEQWGPSWEPTSYKGSLPYHLHSYNALEHQTISSHSPHDYSHHQRLSFGAYPTYYNVYCSSNAQPSWQNAPEQLNYPVLPSQNADPTLTEDTKYVALSDIEGDSRVPTPEPVRVTAIEASSAADIAADASIITSQPAEPRMPSQSVQRKKLPKGRRLSVRPDRVLKSKRSPVMPQRQRCPPERTIVPYLPNREYINDNNDAIPPEIMALLYNHDSNMLHLRDPQAEEKRRQDLFLFQAREAGVPYMAIKNHGGFDVSESTLRGRYRTMKQKRRKMNKEHSVQGESNVE